MKTMISPRHSVREAHQATQGSELVIERRADGQLWAVCGDVARSVRVRRCFPWSQPNRYISLRDKDGDECALVRGLFDLRPDSREVLEQALVEAGFVLEIVRIYEVDEEVEIRNWKVETRQGPRSFQTRLDDWPRQVPGGGILIRDVAGDLYYVADASALDKRSRDLLWVFVD
jgi:hypothetical protein